MPIYVCSFFCWLLVWRVKCASIDEYKDTAIHWCLSLLVNTVGWIRPTSPSDLRTIMLIYLYNKSCEVVFLFTRFFIRPLRSPLRQSASLTGSTIYQSTHTRYVQRKRSINMEDRLTAFLINSTKDFLQFSFLFCVKGLSSSPPSVIDHFQITHSNCLILSFHHETYKRLR